MAVFTQRLWKDGKVQYPGRRRLVNVNTQEEKTVQVNREEGLITEAGDEFNAASLNNLEVRLSLAFAEIESQIKDARSRINQYYPVGKIFMSLKNFNLEQSGQTMFPGTTWIRLKDRKLLIPSTTAGQTYDGETANFSLGGNININYGASRFVQPHTITEAEMPWHYHQTVDKEFYDAKQVTDLLWHYSGDKSDYEETTNPTLYTSYFPTGNEGAGGSHSHSINLSAQFNPNGNSINTRQRCIKVYAWQRTR